MRRIPTIAALACCMAMALPEVSAQHYLGVRAGYGNGSIRFYPPVETGSIWGCKNFGAAYKYYSREKYLGGVEIDFQFIQKGYAEPFSSMPDTVYVHRVNSLELPIFWQPHLYVMGRKMRVFLNAGVVFSYNLDATEETFSKRDGPIIPEQPYDMILVRDNRWGYGLCGGFGINYIMGHLELMAEARYSFGYSDIYKNRNKYADNYALRSPLDNLYFCVGAFWRFGKNGILSEPSKRMAQKMSEREAARAAKRPAPESPPPVSGLPTVTPEAVTPLPPPADQQQPDNTTKDGNDTPVESGPADTEGHQ